MVTDRVVRTILDNSKTCMIDTQQLAPYIIFTWLVYVVRTRCIYNTQVLYSLYNALKLVIKIFNPNFNVAKDSYYLLHEKNQTPRRQ